MSEQAKRGISRRTLVKGAAWSVPVIAAATAVPAYAASTPATPGLTESHTYLNWNYEASKWCFHGQAFEPQQIDGTIADGIRFTLIGTDGKPMADAPILLTLDGTSSGSFWFASDQYQGDQRGAQDQTITLLTDANGVLALDGSVPGVPESPDAASGNWGWLRYGSGAKSGVTLTATATGTSFAPVVLMIANGSEGKNPHPGNKTRNYSGYRKLCA